MNGQTPAVDAVRASQDHAAAMADMAADEASKANPSVVMGPDHVPLPQGAEITAEALVEAILRMAKTFESPNDMAQAHVAKVASIGMLPDSQGERTGVQGVIGKGRYEFAVWERYKTNPGESGELTVRPSEACELSFRSLNDPLIAAGFSVTKSAPGFKPIIYFGRELRSGYGLHVILSADSHSDPKCVSRVRLEMEPTDG